MWKYGRFAHAQWKICNITLIYGQIAEISASLRKSGLRNLIVTSDFRPEVELRPFCACAMHLAIIVGTVRSFWTWLWGRYHIPQNVLLVILYFYSYHYHMSSLLLPTSLLILIIWLVCNRRSYRHNEVQICQVFHQKTFHLRVCLFFVSLFLPRCMQCRRGLAMRILSVRHTRVLWQNGRKICPDLYTIRKII